MFEILAARLSEAAVLWDTARVGTDAAARYELLLDSLYDYIFTHPNAAALIGWLQQQESDFAKYLLAEVQSFYEMQKYEEQRQAKRRDERIGEWNSYALTRKLASVPSFPSERERNAWITSFIEAAWSTAPGYRVITNFEYHAEAFAWLRAQHSFPDLQELIGLPRPEHHLADGSLNLERKRELLLLGLFSWRGFIVAYRRWHLGSRANPFWDLPDRQKSWQWVVAIGCAYPRADVDRATALLRPPDAYVWQSLRRVAAAWGIKAEPKKKSGARRLPRHVVCEYCHRYFVSAQTRRITHDGRLRRFCNEHANLLQQARALQPKRHFKR